MRDLCGARPFVRAEGVEGSIGLRLARRKGWGESLAKVVRGNDREEAILVGLGRLSPVPVPAIDDSLNCPG